MTVLTERRAEIFTPYYFETPTPQSEQLPAVLEISMTPDADKLTPTELLPGEPYFVAYEKPLMSAEDFGRTGVKGALVGILRAGTQAQPGWRPSPLLDKSSTRYWLVDLGEKDEQGTDRIDGRFVVMAPRVRRGLDIEQHRPNELRSDAPLQLGRSALAKTAKANGDELIRAPHKLESNHFTIDYDHQTKQLAVTYNSDEHGYGASIVAQQEYEPKHMASYEPRHMAF